MTSARTRSRMVERVRSQGVTDERVLAAMTHVARHRFVDEALASRAYEESSLPIGHGQTLSQPWEVARMTEAVMAYDPRRVLEVGAGCGYQSAILAELVERVYAVEWVPELAHRARARLGTLGYANVFLRAGDGADAWRSEAPFDGVLAAACSEGTPQALLDQVAAGGCLVAPADLGEGQRLYRWQHDPDGVRCRDLGPCRFVPLHGQAPAGSPP
jgi:protein-L-isoaspartate(D-aspartate) O-methyltransferase